MLLPTNDCNLQLSLINLINRPLNVNHVKLLREQMLKKLKKYFPRDKVMNNGRQRI